MSQLLQRLFKAFARHPAAEAPEQETFRRLNHLAPLQSAEGPDSVIAAAGSDPRQGNAFVCREAILGRDERVAGYEFALPQRLQSRLRDKRELIRKVYDDALIRNLGAIQVDTLLGRRLAFVDISPAALASPELARLSPDNLVLSITVPAGFQTDAGALLPRLTALREAGYRIGWNAGCGALSLESLLERVDFLLVDLPTYPAETLPDLLRQLDGLPTANRPRLVARQMENYEAFRCCYDLGFDYFHGPFVNAREAWHQPAQSLNRMQVALVLNQVRKGAEARELALALRQDPVLTFKLLRYINSPAMGLQRQLESIDQALVLLGRERLYRWLSLLLLHVHNPGYREWVLMERALVRASFMERLAPQAQDEAFLAGLLSLLEQLLGQGLASLLADITLPEAVRRCLLQGEGPLAGLLALAECCERADPEAIRAGAEALGLEEAQLNAAMFPALLWAHQVIEASGEAGA
ncbi:MAG TPA: HDOD domain-containing protein [Azospira sp.]|nr:HDOD domain-containing protein [Azospira sp.]